MDINTSATNTTSGEPVILSLLECSAPKTGFQFAIKQRDLDILKDKIPEAFFQPADSIGGEAFGFIFLKNKNQPGGFFIGNEIFLSAPAYSGELPISRVIKSLPFKDASGDKIHISLLLDTPAVFIYETAVWNSADRTLKPLTASLRPKSGEPVVCRQTHLLGLSNRGKPYGYTITADGRRLVFAGEKIFDRFFGTEVKKSWIEINKARQTLTISANLKLGIFERTITHKVSL